MLAYYAYLPSSLLLLESLLQFTRYMSCSMPPSHHSKVPAVSRDAIPHSFHTVHQAGKIIPVLSSPFQFVPPVMVPVV